MPAKSAPIATILGEQYADLVKSPWSPAFEDISACLEQLGLFQLQRHILEKTLHFWYLNRRYPKTYKFSIGIVAQRIGISPWYCAEQMKMLARIKDEEGHIIQDHDSPLLVLIRSKNGLAYRVDPAPLLALPRNMARYKRSHKVQRGGLAAQVAEQERTASAPASMEQEQPAAAQQVEASPAAPVRSSRSRPAPRLTRPARSKRAAGAAQHTQAPDLQQQPTAAQEQEAPGLVEAPALPDACIAVLVAFLDAQEMRRNRAGDLRDLVAFLHRERAGLDDSALLAAIQAGADQATAEIAADNKRARKRIVTRFGLLTHKIKEAIAQQQQELADQARRAAQEQEQQKEMRAGLNEAGQRFMDYGSAHDWPGFSYGRWWSGREDWLVFADLSDDATKSTVLRSIEAPAGAAQEQPAAKEASAIPFDEAPPTIAPAHGDQSIEAPDLQQPTAPANVTPIGSRVNSRKELIRTAARKGYPAIRIPGAGLIAGNGDAWERFSNSADHKNIQKALGLLAGRPDAPDEGSAPISPTGPAPAPSSEAPDQGAQERGMIGALIDRAANSRPARWASDSAAGLL